MLTDNQGEKEVVDIRGLKPEEVLLALYENADAGLIAQGVNPILVSVQTQGTIDTRLLAAQRLFQQQKAAQGLMGMIRFGEVDLGLGRRRLNIHFENDKLDVTGFNRLHPCTAYGRKPAQAALEFLRYTPAESSAMDATMKNPDFKRAFAAFLASQTHSSAAGPSEAKTAEEARGMRFSHNPGTTTRAQQRTAPTAATSAQTNDALARLAANVRPMSTADNVSSSSRSREKSPTK